MLRPQLNLLVLLSLFLLLSAVGCGDEKEPLAPVLTARPANPTCVAFAEPSTGFTLEVEEMFTHVSFFDPVALVEDPSSPGVWLSLELRAGLYRIAEEPDAGDRTRLLPARGLDGDASNPVSSLQLLNLALPPGYPDDPSIYIYYLADDDTGSSYPCGRVVVLSRFAFDGSMIDPDSEEVLLTATSPWPEDVCPTGTAIKDHVGGILAFDADGYLVLSIGDAGFPHGSAETPEDHPARDPGELMGKVLRIDVSTTDEARGLPYGIPATNPFSDSPGCDAGTCPEIVAWGFRNPWRGGIDLETNQLVLGDVGAQRWEEIDVLELDEPPGDDYGWPIYEAIYCLFDTPECLSRPNTSKAPVWTISHALGQSVTGGYVYRGSGLPELAGAFLYADWITGQIWSLTGWHEEDEREPDARLLLDTGLPIASFAMDAAGEPILLTLDLENPGRVFRLVRGRSTAPAAAPAMLSETGCFEPDDPEAPVAGLIPYALESPLWSDGADKQRWLGLPDGETISVDARTGDFDFPIGTVLVKRFSYADAHLETRLLVRHEGGAWAGYTYKWDDTEGDGALLDAGLSELVGAGSSEITWDYPSPGACLRCHTSASGRSLGPRMGQVERVSEWLDVGLFDESVTKRTIRDFRPYAGLRDRRASVEARARDYLDVNCSGCHQPGGPVPTDFDLRRSVPLAAMNVCDVLPDNDLRLVDARRIAPGRPDVSTLLLRMERRGGPQMPPLGTHIVDLEAIAIVREWIEEIDACPVPPAP